MAVEGRMRRGKADACGRARRLSRITRPSRAASRNAAGTSADRRRSIASRSPPLVRISAGRADDSSKIAAIASAAPVSSRIVRQAMSRSATGSLSAMKRCPCSASTARGEAIGHPLSASGARDATSRAPQRLRRLARSGAVDVAIRDSGRRHRVRRPLLRPWLRAVLCRRCDLPPDPLLLGFFRSPRTAAHDIPWGSAQSGASRGPAIVEGWSQSISSSCNSGGRSMEHVENLLKTTLSEVERILNTRSVVGEPSRSKATRSSRWWRLASASAAAARPGRSRNPRTWRAMAAVLVAAEA